MGRGREHRHFMNSLQALGDIQKAPCLQDYSSSSTEFSWQQGVERKNWNSIKAGFGKLTLAATTRQERIDALKQAAVIQLPEQPGPPAIELDQAAVAS